MKQDLTKEKIRVATYRQGQEPKERKITMKNLFAIDFANNTIVASKTTLKKASIPNSAEYKALMKLMKQNPTFTVAEKEIKKAEGKNTYKGLELLGGFEPPTSSLPRRSGGCTPQRPPAPTLIPKGFQSFS